jgi:tetratricopeptide (TPR) repeat protein
MVLDRDCARHKLLEMKPIDEEDRTPPLGTSKDKTTLRRAIVLESDSAQKRVICRLDLTRTLPDLWQIQIHGDGPKVIELRQLIEAQPAPEGSAPTEAEAVAEFQLKRWADILDVLRTNGFKVESLPQSDHQFTMSVDLSTGRSLWSLDAMHEFTGSNDVMAKRLADAIGKVFTEPVAALARAIEESLSQDDVNGAVRAVMDAHDKGTFAFPPSQDLLKAVTAIDVTGLNQADRRLVRDARLFISSRLGAWDVTGTEADALLAEDKDTLTADQIVELRLASATSALKRGHTESGLLVIRELLRAEGGLPAQKRGWCWRNISLVLEPSDAEARNAARQSADAFLQAGEKKEAAKSLVRLSDCLAFGQPEDAVRALDEMFALAAEKGLDERDLGSAARHIRAIRLAELGRHPEAFDDAMAAVKLRRGILGLETQLANSLYLASMEAEHLGRSEEAQKLEDEADALSQSNPEPQHRFAVEVATLFSSFDKAKAEDLSKRAEASGAVEIVAAVRVATAELDSTLDEAARIGLLERTLDDLDAADVHDRAKEPTRLALAMRLGRLGQEGRAESWYRKILAANPSNFPVRDRLIQCLWNQKKWGEAAELLSGEINRFGKDPSLLFARGKSLVEAGAFTTAIPLLTESMALTDDPQLKELSRAMRDRALESGGTLPLPQPIPTPANPITYEALESALADFSKFIAADKRMAFWTSIGNNDHKWVEHPERRGKDFLHTFLKARFQDRMDVFEEIGAGAGRIDLYLKLANGLSAVLELKMCGKTYSSTYAASGEEQIVHYLENRETSRGYLVVFDARMDDFGKALLGAPVCGKFTIGERFIDVRPRVKQKAAPKQKDGKKKP